MGTNESVATRGAARWRSPMRWRVDGWQGDALAFAAGAALPLSFAPFDTGFLAPLTVAVLFLVWVDARTGRAAWRGWLFGLGMFGFGVSWVHESFRFSHVALPLAVVLTALFVLVLALFPALLGYLVARFSTGGERLRLLALFPAGWVVAEWVRGWFLTGFPWLQLGYSQLGWPLAGLAPVVGVYGVSWAVALSAGLLLTALTQGGRGRWRYGLFLILLWGGAWLVGHIQWTEVSGPPTKVALIQGNVPQDVKWLAEWRRPTLDLYLDLTRRHWDADLVVWPETAMPAFYHAARGFLDDLAREADRNATDLLIGLPVADRADGRYFNSAIALGDVEGVYRKRHLVPFGEYLPFKPVLGGVVDFLQIPMSDFSPGPRVQPLLEVAGHKVGMSICYEDAFGEEVIEALPEATLLVNLSNDAWFGDSVAPAQHLQMARMRALETGRYLLRATNTGISAIIGPDGEVLARSPQFEVHALAGEVKPMAGVTPYARLGNLPVVLGILALLAGVAAFSRRRG